MMLCAALVTVEYATGSALCCTMRTAHHGSASAMPVPSDRIMLKAPIRPSA